MILIYQYYPCLSTEAETLTNRYIDTLIESSDAIYRKALLKFLSLKRRTDIIVRRSRPCKGSRSTRSVPTKINVRFKMTTENGSDSHTVTEYNSPSSIISSLRRIQRYQIYHRPDINTPSTTTIVDTMCAETSQRPSYLTRKKIILFYVMKLRTQIFNARMKWETYWIYMKN